MTLSVWRIKRENSLMTISESKLRGLTAVCLMLAVIPFLIFFYQSFTEYKIPVLGNECKNCLRVELVEGGRSAGIYFVEPGTTVNQLMKSAGIKKHAEKDFLLEDGAKLVMDSSSVKKEMVATVMTNAGRLSLGLPIDINRATEDDLRLIKGIGPKTAQNILDVRKKIKRFEDISQLMEVKGIKEKRLAQFRKYLYVEKRRK
jgi:competence ComEA-like helix-hairpin-helix protein